MEPYSRRILGSLRQRGLPFIHFGTKLRPKLGTAVAQDVGHRHPVRVRAFAGGSSQVAVIRHPHVALGMSQRAIASGNRLFEITDRAPAIASPSPALPFPESLCHRCRWMRAAGNKRGSVVAMNSGWDARAGSEAAYRNADASGAACGPPVSTRS